MITNSGVNLPVNPKTPEEVVAWAAQMQKVIGTMYQTLAQRTNEMIQQGTFALRPTASGRNILYWSTDTLHLYYDDGAWRTIV